jgi:hypothetical protein
MKTIITALLLIALLFILLCGCGNKEYCSYKMPGKMLLLYSNSIGKYAVLTDSAFPLPQYVSHSFFSTSPSSYFPQFYDDSCEAKRAAKKYVEITGSDVSPIK